MAKIIIAGNSCTVESSLTTEQIEKIAESARTFETKKGKAAEGDRVTMDYLGKVDGEAFDGGKDDPNLQLLRFDAKSAQIWLNETSLLAGIKRLFGSDPKEDYKDKTATVRLAS